MVIFASSIFLESFWYGKSVTKNGCCVHFVFSLDVALFLCHFCIFSKDATWEPVPKGTNGDYGPELGVHYGFVDEDGFHAPPDGIVGGIKGVKRPQLAQHSTWTPAVLQSIKDAKRIGQWEFRIDFFLVPKCPFIIFRIGQNCQFLSF